MHLNMGLFHSRWMRYSCLRLSHWNQTTKKQLPVGMWRKSKAHSNKHPRDIFILFQNLGHGRNRYLGHDLDLVLDSDPDHNTGLNLEIYIFMSCNSILVSILVFLATDLFFS